MCPALTAVRAVRAGTARMRAPRLLSVNVVWKLLALFGLSAAAEVAIGVAAPGKVWPPDAGPITAFGSLLGTALALFTVGGLFPFTLWAITGFKRVGNPVMVVWAVLIVLCAWLHYKAHVHHNPDQSSARTKLYPTAMRAGAKDAHCRRRSPLSKIRATPTA